MDSTDLKVAVIYGSYREKRLGIRAAKFAHAHLQKRCESTLIDAKEWNLPILDKMHKEYKTGTAPEAMQKLSEILARSDAFVFVTGEYNHSIPPGLKNLIDHFQKEYFFKPAGILSYSAGSFGGVRVAVHMRAVLGELGMASISTMMPIPTIKQSIDEEGSAEEEKTNERFSKFADELLWYSRALKQARSEGTPY